ncbi:Seven transmembrane MLO family protein [Heracleum sosnowskyi]|uniref:Seven transmembrane MLO family protein n=1 Tax=Heracleum sosnowskyi TaxID=360622 RepID=A0AAD8JFR7_9APIA|nr:Seven transmembrane MLO family protein [Heracleum sosnowskyi]
MACNYPICSATLLGAMDSLWFHRLIPHHLPDPISVLESVSSESFTSSCQSSSSCTSIPEQNYALSDQSPLTPQQSFNAELEEREKIMEEVLKHKRPSKLKRIKTRSHPSRNLRSKRYTGSVMRLQKTMSCKTLGELEVEEVKGFMELGFSFDSENMCPRMMSVLPGLQRLGGDRNNDKEITNQELAGDENETRSELGVYRRPYLSEAWLIRRPDSPLLNLRIPTNSKAADMKKHLKAWARTVASVVHQES